MTKVGEDLASRFNELLKITDIFFDSASVVEGGNHSKSHGDKNNGKPHYLDATKNSIAAKIEKKDEPQERKIFHNN